MGRRVALLICVVIPSVAGCQRQAAPDTRFVIYPGGGIGSVRIGIAMGDARSVLGPPKSARSGTGGETFYAWFDAADNTARGLYVVALAGRVIRAGVHYDPRYVTPVGLRIGVNEGQVKSAMGEPSRVVSYGPEAHGLVYNDIGIGFTIIDGPKVRGYQTVAEIDVFGPKQWKWGRLSGGDWTMRAGLRMYSAYIKSPSALRREDERTLHVTQGGDSIASVLCAIELNESALATARLGTRGRGGLDDGDDRVDP